MSTEYAIYERRSGPGPNFMCRPLVDGKERLIFTGETGELALAKARTWIEKNCAPKAPAAPKSEQEAASQADIFG